MGNKAENNNVENAVVEIINKAVQGIDSTTDFLLSEVPEVIQQLLMWNFAKSLILFLIFLAASTASIRVLYYITKNTSNKDSWVTDYLKYSEKTTLSVEGFVSSVAAVLLLTVSLLFVFGNCDWLMIWIAPKVWLIEYAANLVK